MSDVQLGIKITADSKGAVNELEKVRSSTTKLSRDAGALHAGWAKLNDQFSRQTATRAWTELKRMTADLMRQSDAARQSARAMAEAQAAAKTAASSFSGLGTAIGLVTSVMSGRELYGIIAEYDRLNASLKTVTGSAQTAVAVMDGLKQFARETPYELSQATEAFIRMRSMGLDASMESMRSMGNTASAMGKPLMQFIEAVADATTNEFERLKEFGIKAKQEGDRVTFTFQGVETTVQKSAFAIQEYLLQLGRTKFAGGMVDQMNTVDGALSNVRDSFSQLVDTIGNLGVRDALKKGFAGVTEFLDQLRQDIESVHSMGQSGTKANLENQIAMYRNIVDRLSRGGADVTVGIGSTEAAIGRSKALEDAKTKLAELEKQLASLNGEIVRSTESAKTAAVTSVAGVANSATAALRGLSSEQQRVANQIIESAKAAKLDPALALAIGYTESKFNERAVGPPTRYGRAKGAMQMIDANTRAYGVDNPLNITQQAPAAVKMLKELQGEFKTLTQIAAAYNAGPGNVRNEKWKKFAETRDYVEKVATAYQRFKGELKEDDGFNVAREQFDALRDATQRYINNLDDQAKAAQRQAEITVSGIDNQIAALDRERDAWDKAQQDKLDAAKGSYDAMAQLEAERAAKLQDYAARELALIQQQYDARKRAMEAAAGAYQRQLSNPNLTDDEDRRAKQGLADVQADLVKLANDRAQAEAKAGQAAMDANRGGAELAQKQRAFIANINAELAYQTRLYEMLKSARAGGATPNQLNVMASVSDQMRSAGADVSSQEMAKLRPLVEELERVKQKKQEVLDVDQQVREEQLRLNQAWQEATEQARMFAEQASQSFGMLGDAIGRVVVGIAEYGQRAMQIQRDAKEAIESLKRTGKYSPEKEYQIMERAADKALGNQMGLWGDLTNAMSRFFKEGSDGYKAMTVMSQAFYAIKMGLAVKDAILQIASMAEIMMADTARTGVEVANAGSRAAAKGAEAIMNQGSGDPYSAIPRMIAMAAMVTTILAGFGIAIASAVGGGGSSVKVPDTEAMQKTQGTGSVFGDAEAQSESIRNSLALLTENSSSDLDYTREMRDLLEHIDEGINGLATQIYANVRPPELTEAMIKKGISVVDYGIKGIQQTVGSILKGGLQGQSYQTYKREVEKSSFNFMMPGMDMGGGEKVVKWVRTIFNDIDAGIAKQFGAVLGDVVKSLTMAADGLGVAGPDMIDKINKFVVDIGQVSLKDMNAQEMSDAIHAVISKISDDLARLTMPMLKPFRRAGEGFAETTIRVYEASIRAQASLKGIGVKIIELSDVADKTAEDLAAAITRESIARYENGSSIGEYIRTLQGTTDDVVEQYQELRRARNLFAASGSPDNTLGGDMITGAGGLSKLMSGLDSYREDFLDSTEQLTAGWMDMADNFDAFGLKMPRTSKEFRELVQGIDTSTKAGRELKGAIIAMAPAFKDLMQAMDDAMSTLVDAYETAKRQSQDLRDYLDSLKTGQDTGGSVQERYQAAKALYEETLRKAKAGDPEAIAKLREVSASWLELSKQFFGATAQYAADLNNVQVSLGSLADVIDAQVAQAEAQVPALRDNTSAVTSLTSALAVYTETMKKVGEVIAKQRIDTKDIGDINDDNGKNDQESKAKAEKEAQAFKYENRLKEMVRDLRYARSHGQDKKADRIKEEIDAYIAEIQSSGIFTVTWTGTFHDVQYRAKGGFTPPGLTVVGEEGPELVRFTHPAHVHPAEETARLLRDKSAPEVPYPDWMSMIKVTDIQTRASGGYTPPGLTLVGEEGPELVRFVSPSNIYTAQQTKDLIPSGDKIDTSRIEERLESLERAIGAGLKVDQSGYQVLRAELQGLRAELAEQTRAVKLSAMS